jgi:hypothetical protein
MFTYLVYVSSAARLMRDDEIVELLRQSRDNNARDGISGLLLHKDGNFMQYIEGAPGAVARLHERILADPRHRQIITLLKGETEVRQFERWAMAFQNIERLSEEDRAAVSEFLRASLTEEHFGDSPHQALKLLLSFKRTMR